MRPLRIIAGSEPVRVPSSDVGVPAVEASVLIANIVTAVFSLLGLICVVVIIAAGFRYVTSQGDSSSVSKAKNAILYAVVGLIVAILAFAITRFIADSVTESDPNISTGIRR